MYVNIFIFIREEAEKDFSVDIHSFARTNYANGQMLI
jgi:hypothetical protein